MRLPPRFLALLPLLLSTPALADTLVDNIDGLTIGKDGKLEHISALVIGNDGRIAAVYHADDPKPPRPDFHLDGKGRVLLPGLIDAHVHLIALGLAHMTLDLSDTNSLEEAQAKIRQWAADHPDRPWILGRGWNQERWKLGRFPSTAELDAAVADRPIWLERADGHAGWANGKALAEAKITAATKAPAGGRILGGVLVDKAMALMDKTIPPAKAEDRDNALRLAQQALLSHGITAVADMGTSIEDWQAFRRAGDSGQLSIRIMAYAAGIDAMALIGGPGPSPWLYDDKLRLNGVKLILDGALGSRGAWLKAPYADAPAPPPAPKPRPGVKAAPKPAPVPEVGLPLLDGTQLRNLMSRAAMDHFQVAVHAIGDAANATVLDAIDELSETYKGDRRWRIEHAQIVDPADIPRFGQHGIVASMQPIHQPSDRLMAEARLGPTRLAGAYAWKSILATGATLAFGSDAPVEEPDPFAGLAAAVTRQDAQQQPSSERLTPEQALAAYTTGAAYAGFAEGRLGRLAVGQRADFLLVDRDPLAVNAKETKVLETWVGGKRVWVAGEKKD